MVLVAQSIWRRATGWTTGIRFPAGQEICLYSTVQPASYPLGTGALFPGVKQLGRETDHTPPSSDDIKNDGAMPLLHTFSWCGA
jgi:hypothetical protein